MNITAPAQPYATDGRVSGLVLITTEQGGNLLITQASLKRLSKGPITGISPQVGAKSQLKGARRQEEGDRSKLEGLKCRFEAPRSQDEVLVRWLISHWC